MRRQLVRAALTLICSIGAVLAGGSSSQAAWWYSGYWGCAPRVAYYSYYAPVYRYSACYLPSCGPASCCPTAAYYDASACCAPDCSPCGSGCGSCCFACCDPCCDPCGECCGGACPSDRRPEQQNGTTEPAEDGSGWEARTYQEEGDSGDSNGTDAGYEGRQEGSNGTSDPESPFGGEVETQKPPVDDDGQQVIQQRQPAPAEVPVPDPVPQEGEAGESQDSDGGESQDGETDTSDETERAAEDATQPEALLDYPSLRVPTLDLDRKLTWRSAPSRTRLTIRGNFGNARVSRRTVKLNAGWVPVPDGSTIARK